MSSKILSTKEAAEYAGVHEETVKRWIRRGQLPATLSSRMDGYRIVNDDLEAFLRNKQRVKQKGYVDAESVLKFLAKQWEKTKHKDFVKMAYYVSEESGVLEDYRKKWDAWNGNLVEPDIERANLLYFRQVEKEKEKDTNKKLEGELILRDILAEKEAD